MTTKAIQRNLRVSPQKLRLVIDLIRGKNVAEAITILNTTNKKSAPLIKKLLLSSIANATNNHAMDADKLYIYKIIGNQAPSYKRTLPRAKGSADIIWKRNSHLEITLSDNRNEFAEEVARAKELKAQRKAKGDEKRKLAKATLNGGKA